ncbi:MAG: hypothetical protein J7623_14975 [Chitinophaga sp.]|uniref:hypothetical protein n=1 Tax=Chitinophaga sp. TaxID=1869181 RepID=UPI001B15B508|nr:hypothetical protein [Chitinophaga sp.]MBO9729939.1 hypothetical protein [Chitinophaga sp.]
MEQLNEPTRPWSLFSKLSFRFWAIYFFLYYTGNFSFSQPFWTPLANRAGKLLIRRDFEVTVWTNGSGDTTYNYLVVFCAFLLALLLAVVWSVLDRKREGYDRLQYWVSAVLCYCLATVMISYGMAKLTKSQFPFPGLSKLDDPFGNTSPMGLAWCYMGYSTGYNIFTGMAEFLGGCFLFVRRTRLFGALWSMTVMLNVVAMNFFYDIPVKLFSTHLFLIALFIAAPDIPRLLQFFFSQKPVEVATRWVPAFRSKWKRITFTSLKYLLISTYLGWTIYDGLFTVKWIAQDSKKPPLYGIYEVTQVRADSLFNPWIAEIRRYQKIYIEKEYGLTTRKNNKDLSFYYSKTDTIKHQLSFWDNAGGDTVQLHYQQTGKNVYLLDGTAGKDSIHLQLKRKDPNDYLLVNRGFHWINEHSLNQ